jgi:hypothetical protein
MSYYIDKNLHQYGRVETGWAQRYKSDRIFNSDTMVCPIRKNNDLMGRSADPYSLITTTEGCNSALDRVSVEDSQRSNFFSSVTLSNIGIQGGVDICKDLDTVNNEISHQFQMAKGGLVPDNRAYYSQKMREQQWTDLGEKVQYYKCLSGM